MKSHFLKPHFLSPELCPGGRHVDGLQHLDADGDGEQGFSTVFCTIRGGNGPEKWGDFTIRKSSGFKPWIVDLDGFGVGPRQVYFLAPIVQLF